MEGKGEYAWVVYDNVSLITDPRVGNSRVEHGHYVQHEKVTNTITTD